MQAAKPILKIRSVSNGVNGSVTYTSVPGCGVWVWCVGVVCGCGPNCCELPTHLSLSLIPRPRPAFHHLQYGKTRRAWYLFSHEHDKIRKWRKIAKLTGCVLRIFNRLVGLGNEATFHCHEQKYE